ncbi:5157_t:CDS:2, partial [Scutellospora calospora]
YGETFSLYVFGQLITVVGKESTHEVLKKDKDFDFREASRMQLPMDLIFIHQANNFPKSVIILKEIILRKIKYFSSRLQQNINKALDIFIGECAEPKVIHDLNKLLSSIISLPTANAVVGEECCSDEDLLETFRTLTHSVIKMVYVPPILSFIHPWLHRQYVA